MNGLRTVALCASAWLSMAGCGDEARSDTELSADDLLEDRPAHAALATDGLQSVNLRFKAKVGREDFACGRHYAGIGQSGATATPRDFRFLIESVRLIAADGTEVPVVLDERAPWQTKDVGLLDFADDSGACTVGTAETNVTLTGKVPAGRYRGIVFVNGVPEKLNHADPTFAPAPLAHPGLNWNWLGGYRFLIAEVTAPGKPVAAAGGHNAGMPTATPPADGGMPMAAGGDMPMSADGGMSMAGGMAPTPGVAVLHLGSTACGGNPALGIKCSKPNRTRIALADFDPATSTIVADVAALFAASNLDEGALCHGAGPACAPLFGALGIDFEAGSPVPTQAVFRVE